MGSPIVADPGGVIRVLGVSEFEITRPLRSCGASSRTGRSNLRCDRGGLTAGHSIQPQFCRGEYFFVPNLCLRQIRSKACSPDALLIS